MRILAATMILCVLLPALATSQAGPSDDSLTANPVYKRHCAKCHGKTAEGRHFGAPSLVSAKTASATSDDLRNMISPGKGRMPKFAGKLTPDQIDTLVHQIEMSHNK